MQTPLVVISYEIGFLSSLSYTRCILQMRSYTMAIVSVQGNSSYRGTLSIFYCQVKIVMKAYAKKLVKCASHKVMIPK